MLRAKDCNHESRLPYGLRCMLVGFIVLVGAVTMALRGSAEPPQADQSARGAERAGQSAMANGEPKSQSLFDRAPLDISLVGDNDSGVFAIRVAELFRRPELQPLLAAANAGASQWLHQVLNTETAPEIRLESINYIAGVLNVTIKASKDDDKEKGRGRLMVGTGEVVIRFRDEVPWKEWLTRFAPGAEEKKEGELVYFEWQAPAFGTAPVLIAARDGQTIVWAQDLDRLREMVDKSAVHRANPVIASEWDAAGGGLFTMVFTDKEINPIALSRPEPGEVALNNIVENVSKFSIGIDLKGQSNQVGVRLSLACADQKAAELVRESVDQLIDVGRVAFESQRAELTKKIDLKGSESPSSELLVAYIKFIENQLETHSTTIVKRDDTSFAVELQSSTTYPLAEWIVALVAENNRTKPVTR